jgi:NADH-quinone oxidoreductase subunit N
MVSLAYYLRVVAAVWMRPAAAAVPGETPSTREVPAIAGGSPEADEGLGGAARAAGPDGTRCWVILGLAALAAAATIVFGIVPSPLVHWANHAGAALSDSFPS